MPVRIFPMNQTIFFLPLESLILDRMLCSQRNIVEDAKTVRKIMFSMMAWRTNNTNALLEVFIQHIVDHLEHRAHSQCCTLVCCLMKVNGIVAVALLLQILISR